MNAHSVNSQPVANRQESHVHSPARNFCLSARSHQDSFSGRLAGPLVCGTRTSGHGAVVLAEEGEGRAM